MLRGSHAEFLLLTAAFAAFALPGVPGSLAASATQVRVAQAVDDESSEPRATVPLRLMPQVGEPADPDVSAESPEQHAPPDVEVGKLDVVDPDSGGMLEESMGGLGVEMWSGTPRSSILRLLPQLPARYGSPALHDLARRVLLSTAVAPPRDPGDPDVSLMGLRVERLEAMGLIGAVVDMIALAPNRDTDPYLVRAGIDTRLLLGDIGDACDAAKDAGDILPKLYWEKVTIFCQLRSGDTDAAAFGIKLLTEDTDVDDPAFFALADALTAGRSAAVDSLVDPTPLHLAMARVAKISLPSDVLDTKSPLILRALADSPAVSTAVRIAAAERAALAGAIGPHRLAERYSALEFTAQELASAVSRADRGRTAVERGLLYQAAQLQELPVARAGVVQKALQVGARDDMYLLTARLYRPLLEQFEPSAELAWFGADAAKALYVLERPDLADLWVRTVRQLSAEADQGRAVDILWPLARLADEVPGWRSAVHDRWLVSLRETDDSGWRQRAGLAYALLESFGEPVPDENWAELMHRPSRPDMVAADPSYMRAFRFAVAGDRRGETAVLAILLIESSGLDRSGPVLLAEIIEGLTAVGLASDARRLAIEATLKGGL